MPTPNLGLPTIEQNQTADIVRDINALATAIDGLDIETSSEAQSKATTAEQNANNYTDQTAGELRNDIGILGDLTTTDKTSLVGAVNELDSELNSATSQLNSATPLATPDTLAKRDANGNVKSGTPIASDDVARKSEIDSLNTQLADKAKKHWFDVTEYGAKGDGTTDDKAAIQSAVNAVKNAGGGTVYFPKGTYYASTLSVVNGVNVYFTIDTSNITFLFDNGAKLVTSATASGSLVFIVNPTSDVQTGTFYNMQTVNIGDSIVTLTNSSDAAQFSVGSWVALRCKDTLGGTTEPIGEINRIVKIDGANLHLKYPSSKKYEDDGVKKFGIKPVNKIIENVRFENMALDHKGSIVGGNGIVGYYWINCELTCLRTINHGWVRDGLMYRCKVRLYSAPAYGDNNNGSYFATPGVTGNCDYAIIDNDFTADEAGYVHIHEGASGVLVENNRIRCAEDNDASYPTISVGGGCINVIITKNTITNNKKYGVLIQGGTFDDPIQVSVNENKFYGTFGQNAIKTLSPGVEISDNIMNLTITSGSAILADTANNKITGNKISGSITGIGIQCNVSGGRSIITDNRVENSVSGQTAFLVSAGNIFRNNYPMMNYQDTMFLPSKDFTMVSGTPTYARVSGFDSYKLDSAAVEGGIITVAIPNYWKDIEISVLWSNDGAGAGDVRWNVGYAAAGVGNSAAVTQTFVNATHTAGAQNIIMSTSLSLSGLTGEKLLQVAVYRDASNATDTLPNDVAWYGVILRRAG